MFNIFRETDNHTNKKTTPNELTAVLNNLAWRSGLVKSGYARPRFYSSLVHIILLPIDLVKRKLRQISATVVTTEHLLARGMKLFHHHFTNLAPYHR